MIDEKTRLWLEKTAREAESTVVSDIRDLLGRFFCRQPILAAHPHSLTGYLTAVPTHSADFEDPETVDFELKVLLRVHRRLLKR